MNIQKLCEEQNLMEQYKISMDDGNIQRLQLQLQRHQEFQLNLQNFLTKNPFQMVDDSINRYKEFQSNLLNTEMQKALMNQDIMDLEHQIQTNQQECSILEGQLQSLREYIEAQLYMILPNIQQIRVIGYQILNDREMYVNQIDIRNGYSYNIVGAINIILPQNKYFRSTGDQRLRTYVCNQNELHNLVRSLLEINFDNINEGFREQFNNINTQQQTHCIILDGLYNILRLINQNFDQYRSLRPLKERLMQIEQEFKMKLEIIEVQKQKLYMLRQNHRNLEEIYENQKKYLEQNETIYNNQKELIMIINQCIKLNKAAQQNISILQNIQQFKINSKIIEQINKGQNNLQLNLIMQLKEEIKEQIQKTTIFDITYDQEKVILDQYNLRNIWIHYHKLFLGESQNDQKFVSDSNQHYDLILKPTKLIIQRLLYVFLTNSLAFELQIRNQDYVMKMIENYLISEEFIFESTSMIMFQSYLNFYFEDNIDEDLVNLFLLLINNISMNDYNILDIFKAFSIIVQQYPNKIDLIRHILEDFKYFQKNQSKQELRQQLLNQKFNENEDLINFIFRQLQQQQFVNQIDGSLLQKLIILYGIPSNILENYETINKKLTNYIQQMEQESLMFHKFNLQANNINYLFEIDQCQLKQNQFQFRKIQWIKQQVSAIGSQIVNYELTILDLKILKKELNYKEMIFKPFKLQRIQLNEILLVERPDRFTYQIIEVFLNILGFKGSWEEYKRIIKSKQLFLKIDKFNVEDLSYSNVYRIEQIFKQLSFNSKQHPFYGKIIQWLLRQVQLFYLKLKNQDLQKQFNLFSKLIEEQEKQIDIMQKRLSQLEKQLSDENYVNDQQQQLIMFIQQLKNTDFDYQNWKQFYMNFQSQLNMFQDNKLIIQFLNLYNIENVSFNEDQLQTYLKITTIQDEFINELAISQILDDNANKIIQFGEQNQNIKQKLNKYKTLRAKIPIVNGFNEIEPDHSILIQGAIQKGWLIQQVEKNI